MALNIAIFNHSGLCDKKRIPKTECKRKWGGAHTHVDSQRGIFLPLGQEMSNLNITILTRLTGTQLTTPDCLGSLPFVLLPPSVGSRASLGSPCLHRKCSYSLSLFQPHKGNFLRTLLYPTYFITLAENVNRQKFIYLNINLMKIDAF